MRYIIQKKNSTKPERIMYEVLKEMKVPFKHRWIINEREVDFIIGDYAIEIDGHEQDTFKNKYLVMAGLTPIHLHNSEVNRENIINLIKQITR